eukprot:scaffold1726_cov260-Pinguiococcus_pyrenoidosus.AAC.12
MVDASGSVIGKKPRHVLANTTCRAVLKLDQVVCMDVFAECRALGRFALRDRGNTVAVGIVQNIIG